MIFEKFHLRRKGETASTAKLVRQMGQMWQQLYESCRPQFQGVRLPDAEVMYRLVNATYHLMVNNLRGIQGFVPGSVQEEEVFESVKDALYALGWDVHKRLAPQAVMAEAERLAHVKGLIDASIERWGVPRPTDPEVNCPSTHTPEALAQLMALSAMFGQLHHHLARWTQMQDATGDRTPAAMLELFEVVWCLFDGHTRDSHRLRERLEAFGELYGFSVQFHLPVDADESAWLKAHGIAPTDTRRL